MLDRSFELFEYYQNCIRDSSKQGTDQQALPKAPVPMAPVPMALFSYDPQLIYNKVHPTIQIMDNLNVIKSQSQQEP